MAADPVQDSFSGYPYRHEVRRTELELDHVERWRETELLRAGYKRRRALILALDHKVDLHRACDLLRAGCPERLAFRIMRS